MFEDILDIIRPKKEEREKILGIIDEFVKLLEETGIETFLGGSFAKDTWLSGDYDVDLFVLFEKDDKKMSENIEKVLIDKKLNYQKIHGSRDYFRVFYKGVTFELVPILKIKNVDEAKNVTDLSPFHVKYVLDKIKDTKLNDEIRLLKAFMKANDLYGAESYIRGFSGYVCELLIIYYKSFYNLIRESISWKPKVFIDIEKYYLSIEEAIKNLGKDKTRAPMILIDPTNPKRNASSALSTKKFSEFIFYSNLLLNDLEEKKEISKYFIKSRKIDLDKYVKNSKKYKTNLIYLEIEGKGNSKDIKNSKALKVLKKLIKKLRENYFLILGKRIFFEDEKLFAILYIFPKELPEYELKKGPHVWDNPNFKEFIKKHKDEEIFIEEDGRLSAITKRKYSSIESLLEKFRETVTNNIDKIYYKIY